MSNNRYWWSRYGDFDAGAGIYPHMGQVIAHYRFKRGFRTQQDLATALGYSKRTIEELEGTTNLDTPDSIERRMVLAKLLRIPPALLALDWRFLVYQENGANQEDPFAESAQLLQDDTFTLYQHILRMGRGYLYNGGPGYIAAIVDESLNKLRLVVQNMPVIEKEAWLEMLCRYYQLSTSFALRRLDKKQSVQYAKLAIDIARELESVPLLISALYRRIRVHLDLRKADTADEEKRRHLERAKVDAQMALRSIEHVGPILRGNVYLIAAEAFAFDAGDASTRKQCEKWQDRAATIVYKNEADEDDTFLKLNTTALHHEKAKTSLQFGRFGDAHSELMTARKTLQADLLTWHINLHLTEAQVYRSEADLEGSALSGIEAYKIARVVQSPKDEREVKKLFVDLKQLDASNPYICNLGVTIGMY